MKLTPLLMLIALSFTVLSQSNNKQVYGNYLYRHTPTIHTVKIILFTDNSFEYHDLGCIQDWHATGKWNRHRKSLTLNSLVLERAVPITVTEQNSDTPTNGSIWFECVDDWGRYNFNGDTLKEYVDLVDSLWPAPVGSVDSFRWVLTNGASSGWYKIRNKQANHIRVQFGTKDYDNNYVFLVDSRYRFTRKGLRYLGDGVIEYHRGKNVRVKLVLKKETETSD